MKKSLLLLTFLYAFTLNAQTTSDFESFNLDPESFLNGSDGSGGFTSGNLFFPNDFNSMYGSWSGWAISNTTDSTTPGFDNPFSAITGGGYDGSDNYGISFVSGASYIGLLNEAAGGSVDGFYITNSTWAYLSMQNGDNYAKRFGGATGNDPDYFLLTIKKIENGTLSQDSVDFYLADFRFTDNSEDYIVDEWTYVDLSSLGNVDSLVFTLNSTDVGTYGMNTPAFFCMDNATTSDLMVDVNHPIAKTDLTVFPNPTEGTLYVRNVTASAICKVYNMQGTLLLSQKADENTTALNMDAFIAGSYILSVTEAGVTRSQLFLKK